MKNIIRIGLTIGLAFFFQKFGNSQTNQDQQYLKNLGIADSIYSKTLTEYRKIYIQLPASFNPEKSLRYPVVYILDGEIFLPTVSIVLDYYSGGFMPEMVIIGISNEMNRVRDLTTSNINTKYGLPFNEENGEAERFGKFIENEVIPYIESKYPVTNFRTLIGHSYGGLFAIYTLLKHPQLFSNYIAIDPSLDWDDQRLLKEAQGIVTTQKFDNKSLFMSLSGQLHMQDSRVTIENVMQDTTDFTLFSRSNIAFSDVFKQSSSNGLSFAWKFYPKDLHGTIPLPSIRDGLIALFEWYQMENTDKINSFDTPKEELLSIVRYREKKLKNHFGYAEPPYPEDLLNMMGYMNMDMDQPEKAKMYFELTIEYYPKSVNAYESMADFYEAQGDITNAVKYLNKAYELSGSDLYKERIKLMRLKDSD